MRKRGSGVRRAILPFATAALVLASAGIAYAETFEGTRGANRYVGTPNPDRVELYAGDDTASGRVGADELFGGPDDDSSTARTAATRSTGTPETTSW